MKLKEIIFMMYNLPGNMNLKVHARSSILVIIFLALLMAVSIPLMGSTSAREVQFNDLSSLLSSYDQNSGTYGNLTTGDKAVFEDRVIYSSYDGTETTVWLGSTGAGEGLDSLSFPLDLTADLKTNSRVRFTLLVKSQGQGANSTQILIPLFGDDNIEIIEEGMDDGPIEKDDIEIFGMNIKVDFIPKDYQTPLVRFLLVFSIWAVASVALWFVRWFAMKLASKTKPDVDVKVLKIITGPFFLILLLYGLLISLSQLDLDEKLIDLLDMIYRAGTIILVAYIAIKVFKKVILVYLKMISAKTETQADDVLVPVLGKVITVIIWVFAAVAFLRVFGVDVTVFLGAMGIIGLVIAFAAQDTLSNFFSGIMILLDRPFKEGDWIMMEDSVYQVKDIGLRSTRLFHSFSNQVITIPNNKISDHIFSNLEEPNIFGRKTVNVGVSYDNDPKRIGRILMEIVHSHPETYEDDDHSLIYRFSEFGDSSLDFSVTFWVKNFNDQWRVASEIREQIYHRFEKEGIEIPFPQSVVHLPGGGKVIGTKKDERHLSVPDDMQNLAP